MKAIIYQDARKQWRWRILSRNGRIIADSGEAYTRRTRCMDGLKLLQSICGEEIQVIIA
jgi:uncharacterized protein YegP (UPF0339 family)